MSAQFQEWLEDRLKDCECDTGVLVPYIVSILEDDEGDEEERLESLESTLASMIDPSSSGSGGEGPKSSEIVSKWSSFVNKDRKEAPAKGPLDLTAALTEIAESKSSAYRDSIKKGPSNTDAAVKAAILAGYSQEEEDLEDGDMEEAEEEEDLLCRNTNAEGVAKAEFDKREKAKASAAAKKEKDKEDRENQKKSQEDRKKKAQEKAAKGERRR